MSDLVLLAGGSVTMTHHVTGTYFMCNDWHDGVGNHTQTWAQDPFAKDNNSHRWFLRQNAEGTVRIESYANHRCLTAGQPARHRDPSRTHGQPQPALAAGLPRRAGQ